MNIEKLKAELDKIDTSGFEILTLYGIDVKDLPAEYQIKAYQIEAKLYKERIKAQDLSFEIINYNNIGEIE